MLLGLNKYFLWKLLIKASHLVVTCRHLGRCLAYHLQVVFLPSGYLCIDICLLYAYNACVCRLRAPIRFFNSLYMRGSAFVVMWQVLDQLLINFQGLYPILPFKNITLKNWISIIIEQKFKTILN